MEHDEIQQNVEWKFEVSTSCIIIGGYEEMGIIIVTVSLRKNVDDGLYYL